MPGFRSTLFVTLLSLARPASIPADEGNPGRQPPEGSGIVAGQLTYDGPLPPAIRNTEAGTQRHPVDVDRDTNGLREAAVWIVGSHDVEPTEAGRDLDPIEVDQVNFEFVPRVLTVDAGRPVAFLNNDVANHGVTASATEDGNRFNVTTPPGGRHVQRFAASRQPVAIGCPVHAAMSAWIFVFDHPNQTVTDDLGRFSLPPLPPGRYTIVVHHPEGGFRRRLPVEVRAGATIDLRIDFHAQDLRRDRVPR